MTTEDLITGLFIRVDDQMRDIKKHPQSSLYPSEVVTLALLFALKGVGTRAFYRWMKRDYKALFPRIPHRTRLFRLFTTHYKWTNRFMAQPSMMGVIDTYGIELIHPRREGRSPHQKGRGGISNKRWIVGGKLCLLLNHTGLIVDWDCDTANVHDGHAFQHVVNKVADKMVVFADTGFKNEDQLPPNIKICRRGEWNDRKLVETVLSMLTTVCHLKKVTHRNWDYFKSRLGYTMTLFNLLVKWNGLVPDDESMIHLHIANFSL